MTDSESDGAGYLSEDIQESGFLDGPRDSAALAASSYARLPHGMDKELLDNNRLKGAE